MTLRRMSLVVLLFSLLLALPTEGARRVAILDLENQSEGRLKEEFSWIGLNVPETLAGKLSEIPGVEVIERIQWKKLVDELRLSLVYLYDHDGKAAELGKQLGAQVIGLGSFVVFAGSVNVNIRFVDVETATILGALNRVSPVDDRLFEDFGALALEAVEVLNRRVIGGEVASLPPGEALKIPERTRGKIERPETKTFDAYALYGKGRKAYDRNPLDEAIALHWQALALDPDYAEAWQDLGEVLRKRGRFNEAEEAVRRAFHIFFDRGDEKGEGGAHRDLGFVANDRGAHDEAERRFRRSLAMSRKLGNEQDVAAALNNLGEVARNRGRFDEAERLYQESLAIKRRLGNELNVAAVLHTLGEVAESRGRTDEAERLYQESLAISRGGRGFYSPGVANTLFNLAILERDRGSTDQAIDYALDSLEISRRTGGPLAVRAEKFLRQLGLRGSLEIVHPPSPAPQP